MDGGDKRMKCVFFEEGKCYAELTGYEWNVDEETKKEYCTTIDFRVCPRYRAKMATLTVGKK